MSKSANFVLTTNNPSSQLDDFFLLLKQDSVYARTQLERGESGTLHFQSCVGYKTQRRLTAMIKRFPGSHIEISRNALATWNYCGKDDTRVEGPLDHGLPPASRAVKGDTKSRNALILKYGPLRAVQDGLVPIEKFRQLKQSLDLFNVMKKDVTSIVLLQNEWHYGVTGAGKSYHVRTSFPEAFVKSNNLWWDGYQGEDVVVIEEMGPKQIGAHHLKIWADHYPFKAESKGSQTMIRPSRIMITSNFSIRECFPDPQDYLALERRFTVHHYTAPFGGITKPAGV